MKSLICISLILGIAVFLSSCGSKNDQQADSGHLVFSFEHYADGSPLVFDQMNYTNAAGNKYEVTEIQYFISDLTLNGTNGDKVVVNEEKFAHYIDTNLPYTNSWTITDEIPAGAYESVSMIFGIRGEKNEPFMFTDPPESDMLWPINLGGDQGGYHYMKLNGFWVNKEDQRDPFNFHLGVGQERDADNNITGFVQNWIEMELPNSAFELGQGETQAITIRMNVDQWWENPNIYNHDIQGGKIMQNQEAMRMGAENAKSVFRVSKIGSVEENL
jgi:hypothetical protein